MTKRVKIFAILMSVVMFAAIVCSIGATAAIWTSGTSAEGGASFDATIERFDWNVWAKYFGGVKLADGEARLTGFKDVGFNDSRLIIPMSIAVEGEDGVCAVTEIASGLFDSSVLKEMVEEIYIPHTVKRICANAFSGFANLKKVVFADIDEVGSDEGCFVEAFAFSGCGILDPETGVAKGNRKINFAQNAFFPNQYPPAP